SFTVKTPNYRRCKGGIKIKIYIKGHFDITSQWVPNVYHPIPTTTGNSATLWIPGYGYYGEVFVLLKNSQCLTSSHVPNAYCLVAVPTACGKHLAIGAPCQCSDHTCMPCELYRKLDFLPIVTVNPDITI